MGRTNTHKPTTAAPGLAGDAPPPALKPHRAPKTSVSRAAPLPSRPPPPKEKKAKKDKKEKKPAKRARDSDDDDDEEEEKKPAKKAKKPVRAPTPETERDSELELLVSFLITDRRRSAVKHTVLNV
ncbi:uncharacterized protein BDZ99DRAFT_551924 [Mytilinidion resinicola]|uniref:Uncharacterized protein n=1 Tax=Mytilinidion resinicola TaxID=574789 RepID=A0A6A6Y0T9_9PEZI|nr:uncharacterized protein BDZ99DRAFT_551924 [Mytilinidion resinicola]KAF2802133.1 hypothetical protein BDZ99DRAFT_551924 [Mytilinidion resinicola]